MATTTAITNTTYNLNSYTSCYKTILRDTKSYQTDMFHVYLKRKTHIQMAISKQWEYVKIPQEQY